MLHFDVVLKGILVYISLPGAHPACDKKIYTSNFRVSDDETDSLKCSFYFII